MPILSYVLSFKPQTNQFRIDVQLQDGRGLLLAVNSIEEFTALAAVLNRGNAVMQGDGTIQARG